VAAHTEILAAARRLCGARRGWRFRLSEIVQALPHLSAGTVRTHVVSRCCTNAPPNHPHRWDYFTRVARGIYEIRTPHRARPARKRPAASVAEPSPMYAADPDAVLRHTIHAVIGRSRGWYVAECLEVAVVTQGKTLDEVVDNLEQAVGLHLEDEDPASLGLVSQPRLTVTYELAAKTS
jgi:predicted RNase H-like HicB family nuclease